MNYKFLELLKNQFCEHWASTAGNVYNDPRKDSFHQSLQLIRTDLCKKEVPPTMSDNDKRTLAFVLDKFSHWTSVLNSNVQGVQHNEIYCCLDRILAEWLQDRYNNYILMLSEGDYLIQYPLCELSVQNALASNFNSSFSYQIVDIRMPKHLCGDVFSNVSLFHEMGHFVDYVYKYHDKVLRGLDALFNDDNQRPILINQSFPYLGATGYDQMRDEPKILCHLKEYIADLFGAQYVGLNVINYVALKEDDRLDKEDDEHPCYNCREAMINAFLQGATDNLLLNVIKVVFHDVKKGELEIRYINLDPQYFIHDTAYPITNNTELFSIFKHAWDCYQGGTDPFNAQIPSGQPRLNMNGLYLRLTKLVKESINAYI